MAVLHLFGCLIRLVYLLYKFVSYKRNVVQSLNLDFLLHLMMVLNLKEFNDSVETFDLSKRFEQSFILNNVK